jgi:SagB-type dehydrogenase family enzyme
MKNGIGDDYLANTKYLRGQLPTHRLDWPTQPSVYKMYPSAKRIALPEPRTEDGPGIWMTIGRRRSVRAYNLDALTLDDLSQLLWASQGVTGLVAGHRLRASPSAGALYPIETYVSVQRVEGLENGLYHYRVDTHELELLRPGDFSQDVRKGALDQAIAQRAAVVFIWSGVFFRSKWKYLQRAYRYIFLDAGHLAQNLALAAEALELGSCQIGAIYDDELNALLELDGTEESVIYMSSVGRPARVRD